jgi:hypothetical protein
MKQQGHPVYREREVTMRKARNDSIKAWLMLVVVSASVAFFISSNAAAAGILWVSPDGRYSAVFPGTPVEVNLSASESTRKAYLFPKTTKAGLVRYTVVVFGNLGLPKQMGNDDAKKFLEMAAESLLREVGGDRASLKLKWSVFPGVGPKLLDEFTHYREGVLIRSRGFSFLDEGRIIRVAVSLPDSISLSQQTDTDAFLQSFRVIKSGTERNSGAPAQTNWVKVTESDDATHYIDPATVKKDSNSRKAWDLQDLKQRDKDGAMSRRGLVEYDCKEERRRLLAVSSHSEPMAGGKTLHSDNVAVTWGYIAPNTVAAIKLKIVCSNTERNSVASAQIKWATVSQNRDGYTTYIAPATIKKDGDLRRVWMVTDLEQLYKDGEKSIRGLMELDCKARRSRTLVLSLHSERMAEGKQLSTFDKGSGTWTYITTEGALPTILKIVCAK